MPDDNSCMFTAFGGVLQRADPAPTLRREVAEYILAHPDKFNKVVLEMEPQRYARTIQCVFLAPLHETIPVSPLNV